MIRRNIAFTPELYARILERCKLLTERDGEPVSVSRFIRTSANWALDSKDSPHHIRQENK